MSLLAFDHFNVKIIGSLGIIPRLMQLINIPDEEFQKTVKRKN
jgi:hypothetical protein